MTVDEFVNALKIQTSDSAVTGTLVSLGRPPGRRPAKKDIELSKWFNQLEEDDKKMLAEALREAAELAIFSFLCILDGVSVIEDSPTKGELELYFTKGSERVALNGGTEELHNIFNRLCKEELPGSGPVPANKPYEAGEVGVLKQKLRTSDGLDVHKIAAIQGVVAGDSQSYPGNAPALTIPKSEHRKL